MAKKERPPVESAPLKHSPFAALRAARGAEPAPAAHLARGGRELVEPSPDARSAAAGEQPRPASAGPHEGGRAPAEAAAPQRPASAGSGTRAEAPSEPPQGKSRGRLVQRRETKHRAGKAVIIVSGFEALRDFDAAALETLAKELKQALGCGGTLETRAGQRELVLQGDRPAQVAALLRARGFRVDGVTR